MKCVPQFVRKLCLIEVGGLFFGRRREGHGPCEGLLFMKSSMPFIPAGRVSLGRHKISLGAHKISPGTAGGMSRPLPTAPRRTSRLLDLYPAKLEVLGNKQTVHPFE